MTRHAKKIIKTILGFGLILFGAITGPFPIFQFWIPVLLGLWILASEYAWARKWFDNLKAWMRRHGMLDNRFTHWWVKQYNCVRTRLGLEPHHIDLEKL